MCSTTSASRRKIEDAKRGVFAGLISSVNCRKRTPFRLDDKGPEQLVSRSLPFQSNFDIRPSEEAQLLQDNDTVEICCVLAVIIAAWDGFFMFESPADRGDETRPDLYVERWWDHAPMHLLECFQHLLRLCDVVTLWFHLACFGSDFLGPTDFHLSANISDDFHGLTARRTLRRDQPKKAAGWIDGELHSGQKARFPVKLNKFIQTAVTCWLVANGRWKRADPIAKATSVAASATGGVTASLTNATALPTLATVSGEAVCLVPLEYGVGDLLFGSLQGSFVGSALPPGSGSVGTRSEEAANSLAATLGFDVSHMFGCGALSSQSTGNVCHVYVAPAVDGWRPPSSIVFVSAKEIHDALAVRSVRRHSQNDEPQRLRA